MVDHVFDLQRRLPRLHIQKLHQVAMPMGFFYFPAVQLAALGDRLAMNQVGRRPGAGLTVELEHRNRRSQ